MSINFCEKCGAKLEANEKFCSNCGAPIEKISSPPNEKVPENNIASVGIKFLIGAILVPILFMGLMIIFALDSSPTTKTKNNTEYVDPAPAKEEVKPVESPAPPPKKNKSSVDDGYNYSCKVNNNDGSSIVYKGMSRRGVGGALYDMQCQKTINSNFGLNHTARGTFYIVTIIVGNMTNEPLNFTDFYLIDDKGRKYAEDINAGATFQTMNNFENPFSINPNQPVYLNKVFDIPDGVNIKYFRLESFVNFEENNFNVPFNIVTE